MSIGLGILGLGTAGAAMLGAALDHDRVTVTAVADTDIAQLSAEVPGTAAQYDSLDRMLADDRVTAVHIATPTTAHCGHVLKCLEAGRHVIVEKPVTATTAEADELAARAAGVSSVVIVGHTEAFEPYVRAVGEAVTSGMIGRPLWALFEKATDWLRRPRLAEELDSSAGGGLIRRQGAHQIEVIRSVLAGPLTVLDAGVRLDPDRGVPGSYYALLAGEGGQRAFLAHDGIGRLSGAVAGGAGAGAAAEEATKRARRADLLRRVRDQGEPRLGAADRERLVVVGTSGEIVASSQRAEIRTSAGVRELDLAGLVSGRHAVLDELAAAVSGTCAVPHDLCWGRETLRLCEEIERVAAAGAVLAVSAGLEGQRQPADSAVDSVGPQPSEVGAQVLELS